MQISDLSLNYYSFGYCGGFVVSKDHAAPILGIPELSAIAKNHGLGGIEIPFDRFFGINEIDDGINRLEKILKDGVSIFIDLEKFDENYLNHLIPCLARLGIKTIRVKMDQIGNTIYGGNRYLSKTFDGAVKKFNEIISKVLPTLEKFDVHLAIENHQDLHSIELLSIAERHNSELIGITWDIGNSLALGDTFDSFFANAGHLIKNVHLKDYKVFKSTKGIRLVRCPLGEGVVDYLDIFKKLIDFDINMSIELGAQITRECNIFEDEYWEALKDIPLNKDMFIEFINKVAQKSEKSCSSFEQGLNHSDLVTSELDEVEISVKNLNVIFEKMNGR